MTGDSADVSSTPLRRFAYALLLALFAFVQKPGQIVADTKFDLMVDPGRFMGRAMEMWDGSGAFGQIQNQAYGYLFPMGPFFWVGEQLGADAWVTQRLWWTMLLCLAFFGALRVAETLGIGKSWTRVVAAFAYALSVHITTIIGASSVEAWPTALVPWVLWAVMRATDGGSERRWAAVAGLLTFACGGVNAVAVAVVLPLGAAWILTRDSGRRRWVVFAWWVGTTLLATLWWLVPLLLMGGYSFPFLDYIENATVTTAPTGLADVVGGTSTWVSYVDPDTYPAGSELARTPFLIVDAALLAGLGVAGLARRDTPHRQFLLVGLVIGVVLVSLGYTGAGSGWAADARQGLLDGALAPLRNLHKFDAVLRLPLVLGLAHLLSVMMPSWSRAPWSVRMWPGVAVLALAGTASPWFLPTIAPAGAMDGVPGYWTQVARYLNDRDDGRTLVVPAAGFGTYQWGSPRDDVLQPLMEADWAVRNVVPLAEPGNVAFLDAVTEQLESGRPSLRLAEVLRANGVTRLVVRNDLDRVVSGAPDPVIVHQALRDSPGLRPAASFGPDVGWAPVAYVEGDKVLTAGGLSDTYSAVEVYDVVDAVGSASVLPADRVPVVAGGAGAALASATIPGAFLLPEDSADRVQEVILTDTMRRREKTFAAVRDNESATMAPAEDWRLSGREHFHRMTADQEDWQATVGWSGVERVSASSSQAWADAAPPLDRAAHPGAVLDGDRRSGWSTARGTVATGQWWQVDFGEPVDLDDLALTVDQDSYVTRVRLANEDDHVDIDLEDPGEPQQVSAGLGESEHLRVEVLEVASGADLAQFSLQEVDIPGVEPQRLLDLTGNLSGAQVSGVSLHRDPDTSRCFTAGDSQVCLDRWADRGEDGDVIARRFDLPGGGAYDLTVAGSPRAGEDAVEQVVAALPIEVATSSASSGDLRGSALALVDGRERTTWVADDEDERPQLDVRWPQAKQVSTIRLALADSAAASRPTRVSVSGGGESRTVDLDRQGRGRFAPLTAREVTVRILGSVPAYDGVVDEATRLPPGASGMSLGGPGNSGDLVDLAEQSFTLGCGQGPSMKINGQTIGTRVRGTVAGLTAGSATIEPCAGTVRLQQGRNTVISTPGDAFRIDNIDFLRADVPTAAVEPEVPSISTWDDKERKLTVAGSGGRRLLVVSENFNRGWEAHLHGKRLEPQRVGGWQQGWWLPAGSAGEVELTFAPQSTFTAGLVAGGVALLGLLALALVPGRRQEGRPPASAESDRPLLWFLVVPAAGLLAGWAGFGVAVLAVVAHRVLPQRDWSNATSVGAAVLIASAGLWTAWQRSEADTLTTSSVTQLLVLGALVVAAVGAKGPEFLKRSIGRSTT